MQTERTVSNVSVSVSFAHFARYPLLVKETPI